MNQNHKNDPLSLPTIRTHIDMLANFLCIKSIFMNEKGEKLCQLKNLDTVESCASHSWKLNWIA